MSEFRVPAGISITAKDNDVEIVRTTLARLPAPFVQCIADMRIDIRVLEEHEKFADVGKRYATSDAIDYGVCQGLYAMADRQVIIKVNNPAIIAHELFHCFDFYKGDGDKMRSQLDDRVAERYRFHKCGDGVFISRYGSVNPVEFVAEFGRAALGFSLQPPGRPHDLDRLKAIDPQLVELVQAWLNELKPAA